MAVKRGTKRGSFQEREARQAMEDGRSVYVAKLSIPATQQSPGGGMSDWADSIEAIEAAGWELSDWTVAIGSSGRPEAYPLFRPSASTPSPVDLRTSTPAAWPTS